VLLELEADALDFKEKIKMFIEIEKLKLVSEAIESGLTEKEVMDFLEEENIPDFDLSNLRSRI